MQIIRNVENFELNNTAIAIGKFDGIHKGHRLIMEELAASKSQDLKAVVFTFSKSPDSIVKSDNLKYLLTNEEKYRFYEKMGIDVVIEYPMSEKLLCMEREGFLKDVLVDKLGMKKIICGDDFKFGHNRLGDTKYLFDNALKYGYNVKVFDKLKINKTDISSTLVRGLISEGEIEKSNDMLGYPYTIIGKVVHGNEIGRTINFPTANIIPDKEKLLPPNGVYFTKVNINGKDYKCVTNIGKRPTVGDNHLINVETNIFDFTGDLYDTILEVRFYKYHRSEIKFESTDELKKQIEYDAVCCKDFLYNI
ncbi:MAG: bifunctional riboflavin kinase/FAD synthetase [Lachnospiraceae bacterium]|nr:bifunctional riboflavin kinase/FAD synthetase [Lachnospiraceae bacterium]